MQLDEDTLASMTPEEIAAFNGTEDEGEPSTPEEIAAAAAAAATAAEPEAEDEADDDDKGKGGDADPEDDDPEDPDLDTPLAPEKAPAAAAPEPEDAPMRQPPVATFTTTDSTRLAAIEDEVKALAKAADEGDEAVDSAVTKIRALEREAAKLEAKKEADAAAVEAFRAEDDATWQKTVDTWFAARGIDKDDETAFPDDVFNGFDAQVKALAASGLSQGLSMRATLDMALSLYEQKHPGKWPGKAPAPAPKPGPGKREVLLPPRIDDLAPPAESGGVENGVYAQLDRLMDRNPERYEERLAAMSEDAREAYLASR